MHFSCSTQCLTATIVVSHFVRVFHSRMDICQLCHHCTRAVYPIDAQLGQARALDGVFQRHYLFCLRAKGCYLISTPRYCRVILEAHLAVAAVLQALKTSGNASLDEATFPETFQQYVDRWGSTSIRRKEARKCNCQNRQALKRS